MIYIVAVLLPPLGLLLNGQPFAAVLNIALIIPCLLFGLEGTGRVVAQAPA